MISYDRKLKDKGKGVQGWGEKAIGKEIAMQVKGLEFDYHNIFKKQNIRLERWFSSEEQ